MSERYIDVMAITSNFSKPDLVFNYSCKSIMEQDQRPFVYTGKQNFGKQNIVENY